jgi:hypothetical protein
MRMEGRTFVAGSIRNVAAGALALGLSATACGGGSSAPPNCLQVSPCGGSLVGTWSFLGTCSDVAAQSAQASALCPGFTINSAGMALSGTFTFNADFTYVATNWHETFVINETVPLSCAGVAACADRNGTITTTNAPSGQTTTLTTSCTGAATCACRLNGTLSIPSDSGTWVTSGTTLDLSGAATAGTLPYCVEGDHLHLLDFNDAGQPVSDFVAVRVN